MNYYTLPKFFSQTTYGEGAYSSEAYQESTEDSGGGLVDTGAPVVVAGTVGAALILCAVVLFVQARKNKKKN